MTVIRNEDGTFDVIEDNGSMLIGGFPTDEAAWQWIDQQDDDELAAEDRRRRIQTAFAER